MPTRPIFHSSDAAIRGHVFCSFLALAMQKHLDDLLARPVSFRNGRTSFAISTASPRRASAIAARLARAHRRCSRRDHAVQERPHRLAAARPSRPTPAAGPVQIRSKPPRPPKA